MIHGNQGVKNEDEDICDGDVDHSLLADELSLLLAVLVVHPVQEDDPEKDEENNEVDNEEDREVGAGFVGVHHGDGVEGVVEKYQKD